MCVCVCVSCMLKDLAGRHLSVALGLHEWLSNESTGNTATPYRPSTLFRPREEDVGSSTTSGGIRALSATPLTAMRQSPSNTAHADTAGGADRRGGVLDLLAGSRSVSWRLTGDDEGRLFPSFVPVGCGG